MATRQEIEINFAKAKREIDKLDTAATDLYKLSCSKFSVTLEDISSCWKGDNANAFIGKGRNLKNMMRDTAMDLANIVIAMRTTVNNIYQAEMKALEIAKNRDY